MRRRGKWCGVLAGLAMGLAGQATPAGAAISGTVGPGHGAGLAVDGAGTAHVAWKVEEQGNAVFYCALPRNARSCPSGPVPVPFPDEGFNRGSAGVFVPSPGVVDVVVAREPGTFLSRSTDGGRTFAPGVQIFDSIHTKAVELADGRIGMTGSNLVVSAGLARRDGADRETEATNLTGDVLSGLHQDVAAAGNDLVVSGGDNGSTRTFRLPAGANQSDPNAWQPLPAQEGARGRLAAGPSGIFSLIDSNVGGGGRLYVQRLDGAFWGPAVTILDDNGLLFGTALEQDPSGGLHALWTDETPEDTLLYATSGDGGALWSKPAVLTLIESRLADLSVDVLPDGRGAVATGSDSGDKPIQVAWINPRTVPAATARIGDAVVQARSECSGTRNVRVRVRASRGGRAVKVGTVLRGARFSARGARRRSARRYAARFVVRRQRTSARVTVRVRPRARGERSRTLRLAALTCAGRL